MYVLSFLLEAPPSPAARALAFFERHIADPMMMMVMMFDANGDG